MRGAGIFEGVQCCRVDLSGLFADDNQSDWRPKIFEILLNLGGFNRFSQVMLDQHTNRSAPKSVFIGLTLTITRITSY